MYCFDVQFLILYILIADSVLRGLVSHYKTKFKLLDSVADYLFQDFKISLQITKKVSYF